MSSIPLSSFGNLPQLETFQEAACVPTALTNTFAGLARTYPRLSRLIGEQDTYKDLESTRNTLAKEYFLTSRDWFPAGSPVSLVVSGTNEYFASRDVAELLDFKAIGSNSGLANFGKEVSPGEITIYSPDGRVTPNPEKFVTPKQEVLERQGLYTQGKVSIGDIEKALDSGSGLVLGLIWRGGGGGHAVSAVDLNWKDKNNDGLLNKNESATLHVIDPLDPSTSYLPAVKEALGNAGLSSAGPPKVV
jgi:hypothetical protein